MVCEGESVMVCEGKNVMVCEGESDVQQKTAVRVEVM